MSWTFMGEAAEDSLTAGEWERIYLLVNAFGLPHAEVDIDPSHCPTCRNAHAVVLLERETSFEEAVALVSEMPTVALIDAFLPTES